MKKWMLAISMVLITASAAYSQGCAMCTKTASNLDERSAKGLNGGILYLATLPLALMGTIGLIWWRRNKAIEQQ